MTKDDIGPLIEKWMGILRLQDWDVKWEVRRAHEMNGEYANIDVRNHRGLALIQFLDPADYTPNHKRWGDDLEETVAHELLHIWVDMFYPEGNEHLKTLAERFIDTLSRVLVKLAAERKESA